jgi:S-adenosylmethionine decarboxylase
VPRFHSVSFFFIFPPLNNSMGYKKGLHFICDLRQGSIQSLSNNEGYKKLISSLIEEFDLCVVGEVHHSFENGGFTSVHCLTESHISIHTWPEYRLATFDVFLSNYLKYNNDIVEHFGAQIIQFFESTDSDIRRIER